MNSESKIAQTVAKATRLLNDVSEDWNPQMLQEANGIQTHLLSLSRRFGGFLLCSTLGE